MNDIWYRYEDVKYAAPVDEFDMPIGEGVLRVHLREYQVVKHTPKGVWLSWFGGIPNRFVLNDARRRFACPTIEEARESFIARKTRQASIYRARMLRAENAMAILRAQELAV